MPTPVTIQVRLDSKQAATDVRELEKQVSAAFSGMRESVGRLNAQMRELTFNPRGILTGTDQAESGIGAVREAARLAASGLRDLRSEAQTSGDGLDALGTRAAGTEKRLTSLAGTGAAVGTVLTDVATGAEAADAALLSLDEGAATAQKSVSGLGRVTGNLLPRLDALSKTVFDPAGIVTGADTAVSALDRVKLAAAEVKASVRGAGSGVPGFVGGGIRRGGGGVRAAEEAGTFGGGLRAGAGVVGDVAGAAAVGATLIGGVSTRNAIDFDSIAQQIAGNTNQSAADQAAMRQAGLRAMRLGLDPRAAMLSFMHISNHKFSGQEATNISDFAAKTAVGTGADQEQTGNATSALLHELGMKATPENVSRVGNMQHQSMASGNMDMDKYIKFGAPAIGKATALGNSPADSAAFITALTQQSVPVPQAATNLAGITWQITHPTAKSQKMIDAEGLSQYFGPDALKTYGLHGILDATNKGVGGDKSKLMSIFNAKQGGFGALIATGKGAADYSDQLYNPKTGNLATLQGKEKPAEERYEQQSQQPAQKLKALKGELSADSIELGEKFIPVLTASLPLLKMLADSVLKAVNAVARLPKPVQEAIAGFAAFKIISSFLPLLSGVGLVTEKTTGLLGGLGRMLLGIGPAAAAGEEGIAGTAAVMSGPFALGVGAAIAAVAGLALAWHTDFGHVREVTSKVMAEVRGFVTSQFGYVVAWTKQNLPEIRETVHTILSAIQRFWSQHGAQILGIVRPMWSLIKTVISGTLHVILAAVKLAMDIINGHWRAAAADVGVIVTNMWAMIRAAFEKGNEICAKLVLALLSILLGKIEEFGMAGFRLGEALGQGLRRALVATVGQVKQAIGNVISGVVNGLHEGAGRVAGAAGALAGGIPRAVMGVLDIHSPSRVMHKLGLDTAEGLAQGIRSGKVSVDEASKLLATSPAAIVRSAISSVRRGQSATRRHDGQVQAAGEFAATVGESAEEKDLHRLNEERAKGLISAQQYAEAYTRIKGNAHRKTEAEAKRHDSAMEAERRRIALAQRQAAGRDAKASETGQQIQDALKAYDASPATPSLNRQEATAHSEYRRQIKDLGGDALGPYSKTQQQAMTAAATLLSDRLAAINKERTDKEKADAQSAQEEADAAQKQAVASTVQLNRELWQHADGDMTAYFGSLTAEADAALKEVTDKFGPASKNPNADVVAAATAEHAARIAGIAQQQTDAANRLSDERTEHDLEQGKISQAQYVQYLTQRRDAFSQYSEEWLALDSKLYSADTEIQRKQLQSAEDLFAAHKISLEQYKKLLSDLAVPASSPVYQDVQSALAGAQNKSNRQMVGGGDFWKSLSDSAAENGSRVLEAILHPKDKKKIFRSMWEDLLGSAEDGLKGGLANILKNVFSGAGSGGFNLGNLFGGLFGGGGGAGASQGAASQGLASAGMFGSLMGANVATGGMLSGLLPAIQGINGPVGTGGGGGASGALGLVGMLGHGGILGGLLGHGGLAGLFAHGGLFTSGGALGGFGGALGGFGAALPWIGGGLALNGLLGNPFGKALKGLKHIFRFSQGGVVPGSGHGDTVPAMLTPGEIVIPKTLSAMLSRAAAPQARVPSGISALASGNYPSAAGVSPQGTTTARTGQSAGSHAEIHYHGDSHYHFEADEERSHRRLAKTLEDLLRSGTPS